jgi:hypothetical protein
MFPHGIQSCARSRGVGGEVDSSRIELAVGGKSVLAILDGEVMGIRFHDGCGELLSCREYKVGEPGSFDQAQVEFQFVDGFGDGREGVDFPASWR